MYKLNYDLQDIILKHLFKEQITNYSVLLHELNIYINYNKSKILGIYTNRYKIYLKNKEHIYKSFIV